MHRLTIDARLQAHARSRCCASASRPLGPRLSAAIIVIDNATGEVRAHVGGLRLPLAGARRRAST